MRNDNKKRKAETGEGPNAPSTSHKVSTNPMEKKKQRKSEAKERRRDESEKKTEAWPIKGGGSINNERSEISSDNNSGLPEFHIGVFKDLSAAELSIRESAALALVSELLDVQKAYDKLEDKQVFEGQLKLEAEKDDGLNNCAPSLRYAVRRLIRGVSSSRECARQGFALGMTVLVGAVPCIKLDALLKLIVELLEVSSSMKGQDMKDCLLGRLFAYGAIARSGRLTLEWTADKNTPYIKEFVGSLVLLAKKKRYLQEPAVSIILELVEKFPGEALLNHVLEVPGLKEWFEGATEAGNPDALLLALTIREKSGVNDTEFGKLLPLPYSPNRLFTVEQLSLLSECLKESTFCHPRTHSVWYSLINILLPENFVQDFDPSASLNTTKKHKKSRKGSSAEEDIENNLKNFCEVIIEGKLLSSSHERKNLAFNVLLLLLPKLPTSCIYNVLSYKVIQCLMDVLSRKDTWLFKASQHFLKELTEWVKHDDVRRVAVIVALQKHSIGKFDCITRTKTVKELMAEFKTESGCMLLIQSLADMFLDEAHSSEEPSDQSQTTDDNSEVGSLEDKDSIGAVATSDFLKGWVVESLPNCLKHVTLDVNAKFRVQREILKFLAVQGLFASTLGTEVTSFELEEKFRWPKSAISSALCRMCIEQLQLLVSNAQKGEGPPYVVASSVEVNDLGAYFMRFLTTLRNIPSVSLFRSLSDDDEEAFQKLQAMESQLSRQERNLGPSVDANKIRSMRYLLIQLLLQVLLRPGEFSEAASELVICCTKTFQSSDPLASSGDDVADEDGTPELMDVLVDTMLSLLPQSSAPMRNAIEQVFKYFCNDVTDDGLLRMLRVITKDLKPARHQEADNENKDDDSEDDDVLDIEEDEESDEAEIDETAESDGQADGSEIVVSAQVPEASDDESDEGMDDDAMFRMDTYLVKIFKEKTNQPGGETAHSQLVLFKLRVLSLLEIYLHENPGKPQVLRIFSNLAQAFVNPQTTEGSEQLSQRIWGILQKKIFKVKDYPRGEAIELSMLESLLRRNLRLAAKPFKKKKTSVNLSTKKQSIALNRYKMINSLAQSSTFWILKIIDAKKSSQSELQGVFEILEGVLQDYVDSKRSQIKCEFLKEVFKRRPWIGHHLFGVLLEKCAGAKLQFRQIEALDLVSEILKSITSVNPDDDSSQDSSKKKLKSHLRKLSHLVSELVKNMPDKASRRADVRKFCGKVIQVVTNLNLKASFLKTLGPDSESQLAEMFPALRK